MTGANLDAALAGSEARAETDRGDSATDSATETDSAAETDSDSDSDTDSAAESDPEADSGADGAAAGGDAATAGPPAAAPVRDSRWVRLRRRLLIDLGVPLGLYAATRVVQLGLIALLEKPDTSVRKRLLIWDAGWFVRVARDGYEQGYSYLDGELTGNGLAFFPAYPLAIRGGAALGLSHETSALAVAWGSGAVAAVLLCLLGTRLYDRRVGLALTVLFGAQPLAVVLSMGYSEALFTAFVAASLLALHRRAWLLAGAFGFLAGMTRSTGLALAAAISGYALWRIWRERREPDVPVIRPLLAAALGLVAAPLYWLWVGLRVGDIDGWFRIQQIGWGSRWDFGAESARFVARTLRAGDGFVPVSIALLLVFAVVATVVALLQRTWLPLSLYGLLSMALLLGSAGYYHSKPRLLVPVILLLMPFAVALGRARPRVAIPVLAGVTLLGCWYGAYMVAVWPYTI